VSARRRLVVGTRGSRLALLQTQLVIDALRARHPENEIEVREVRTEGDQRPDASLAAIGGQGVFVKEIEAALLRGDVDFAVHSLKDVPPELSAGLTLAAVPARADPRDALVTRAGASLEALPPGARIGTGSARRAVQLRALQPDIETADIRGNVDTRLRKVDEGQYDGVVLALAALERLGVRERATQVFGLDVMVPAVGQGALVVEARGYDGELLELLRSIEDAASRLAVEAERAFLGRLGSGCTLPVGALAAIEGDAVRIRGMLADEAGDRIVRDELSGPASEAVALGARLAEQLLESIDG
jgi:hydroxymethylbilane synthase